MPAAATSRDLITELLVLPDGSVLAHNITPVFGELLKELGLQETAGSDDPLENRDGFAPHNPSPTHKPQSP